MSEVSSRRRNSEVRSGLDEGRTNDALRSEFEVLPYSRCRETGGLAEVECMSWVCM